MGGGDNHRPYLNHEALIMFLVLVCRGPESSQGRGDVPCQPCRGMTYPKTTGPREAEPILSTAHRYLIGALQPLEKED